LYETAVPLAVKVVVTPAQVVIPLTDTLGKLLIVMVVVAMFVQPFPSVPVTV
jgi:hypothetical protein